MFGGSKGISTSHLLLKLVWEYEDMQVKVGDKITIEIKNAAGIGVFTCDCS